MRPVQVLEAIRARWSEWRAAFAWVLRSWLRPASANARWEQESAPTPRRHQEGVR